MAKKKENFKGMKIEELNKMVTDFRDGLRKIHFKAEGSRSKNVKEGNAIKKNIARVLTEINAQKHAK